MLKVGMFIQNRYEIISKIGSGGMADVYKAKDHKLNRFVAVKVMKKEFRDDKQFISKFRVEAQSAAGLAHANIVNIYDVGEEAGIYYIVMELVEGITLKEYIKNKGRLSVREATSIALQISAGLEAAHNNGIIHRDIKPQNIIISTDGKVKVADFGIARASSSNTINSSVMGSVHYSSPEQSRGGYSDEKSDIYSLGITMYEMLTGHVPFDGDTAVAVAIKHLQEELHGPKEEVPEIPRSTNEIVLKCTQKSPDRRYANMTEVIRDLRESLVNPDGDFVEQRVMDNTSQTIIMSKNDLEQINAEQRRCRLRMKIWSLERRQDFMRKKMRRRTSAAVRISLEVIITRAAIRKFSRTILETMIAADGTRIMMRRMRKMTTIHTMMRMIIHRITRLRTNRSIFRIRIC